MVIYSVTSQGKVESITGSETGSEVEVVWFMEQYLFPFVGTSYHTTSSPGTMTLVGEKLSPRLASHILIYICNPLGDYHLGNRPSLLKLIIQYYQGQEQLLHAYCPCLHVS